jgi:excisionase family DNA binding protein
MPASDTVRQPREVPRLALSLSEAATALGFSRQHIYNLIAAGKLRSVSLGRSRRIAVSEIERVLSGGDPDAAA